MGCFVEGWGIGMGERKHRSKLEICFCGGLISPPHNEWRASGSVVQVCGVIVFSSISMLSLLVAISHTQHPNAKSNYHRLTFECLGPYVFFFAQNHSPCPWYCQTAMTPGSRLKRSRYPSVIVPLQSPSGWGASSRTEMSPMAFLCASRV